MKIFQQRLSIFPLTNQTQSYRTCFFSFLKNASVLNVKIQLSLSVLIQNHSIHILYITLVTKSCLLSKKLRITEAVTILIKSRVNLGRADDVIRLSHICMNGLNGHNSPTLWKMYGILLLHLTFGNHPYAENPGWDL